MPTSILSITFTISCLLLLHYTYGQKSQVPTLEDPSFENYFLNPDHIPVLQGKILNATPEDLPHLKITAHVVRVGPKTQKAFPIQIEDDFTFRLKLEYSFPYQEIWFSLQDYYYAELMLQDSLMITMDLHKLKKNQQKYM